MLAETMLERGAVEIITGAIVLGVIAIALVLYVAVRIVPVNAQRRRLGLDPLPWRQIGGSRMRRSTLTDGAAHERLSEERELRRQMEWEKQQANHELLRSGRHISRQHCAIHDRWCFHAWEEGHPPGGFNNPTVPDDWPPKLTER